MSLKDGKPVKVKGGSPFKGGQLLNRHGIHSEKKVIKSLGIKQVPASGAMAGCKSDGVGQFTRVECKATTKDSLSVKYEWLQKIAKEARDTGRKPLLTVSFVTGDGNPKLDGSWIMIRLSDAQELLSDIL